MKNFLIALALGFVSTMFINPFSQVEKHELQLEEIDTCYRAVCCDHCEVMVGRTTKSDANDDLSAHEELHGCTVGFIAIDKDCRENSIEVYCAKCN